MERHDVVILGGGLAGLSTAKFLSEKGIDFVLLEEHNDFCMKACGEGLGKTLKEYDFFGLYESTKGVEREVHEIHIQMKHGEVTICTPLLVIDKKEVEKEFARQAIRQGADIRKNEKVGIIEKNGYFILGPQGIKAKVLVGADGVFSIVRRFMGIKDPPYALGVSGICENIEKDKDKCYLVFDNDIVRYGYSWFFPKKNSWNIGIGSLSKKWFKDAFCLFKKQYHVEKWKGGYGPFSKPLRLDRKNMFLVGDAGSQIRSIVGAGNLISIISGKILADTLVKLSKKQFTEIDSRRYGKTWTNELGKMLTREYYLATILRKLMNNDYILHQVISKLTKISSKLSKNHY